MSVRAPLKASAFEASETFELGRFKRARRAYGFDEVALVPGRVTINPQEVDSGVELGSLRLAVPILAAAMDGVVDVRFAVDMGRLGGSTSMGSRPAMPTRRASCRRSRRRPGSISTPCCRSCTRPRFASS